jgi:hypothetical protein
MQNSAISEVKSGHRIWWCHKAHEEDEYAHDKPASSWYKHTNVVSCWSSSCSSVSGNYYLEVDSDAISPSPLLAASHWPDSEHTATLSAIEPTNQHMESGALHPYRSFDVSTESLISMPSWFLQRSAQSNQASLAPIPTRKGRGCGEGCRHLYFQLFRETKRLINTNLRQQI